MKEKILKFLIQPWRKKLLLSEALLFQFVTGLILKLVPFRVIPRLFPLTSHLRAQTSPLVSQEIKQVITITSRVSPWRNKCLVQSLAARWMLNRRGIHSQLSLGVTLDRDKKMIAHAWLKESDFEVVEKSGNYLELYIF
jgi:hypothetical protein